MRNSLDYKRITLVSGSSRKNTVPAFVTWTCARWLWLTTVVGRRKCIIRTHLVYKLSTAIHFSVELKIICLTHG